MISYWVTRADSGGIRAYCENRGRAIAHRFETRLYDQIEREVRLPAGPQIFSALDRLTDSQRRIIGTIWDAHAAAAPTAARLNDPRRVLLRFPLLTVLHEQGVNAYRVFRAIDLMHVDRFPVFVRHMNDHSGPRTQLLHSRREVMRALGALCLRGQRLHDLIVVEFCDTGRRDGNFRKFSAFKIGDSIIPWHLMVSRHWCVKSESNETTEERVREALKYFEDNPHEPWLRRVFAIAGVDYGRVDYGVLDGAPQAWEINLNPTVGRPTGWLHKRTSAPEIQDLIDAGRELCHQRLRNAFVALENTAQTPEIRVTVDTTLLSGVAREVAALRRRSRVVAGLTELRDHPRFGLPARALLRLFPRH